MRLYVVRHGHALARGADSERPLSDEGQAEVARIADLLGRAGVRVDRLVHSGKTRARQTAEILAAKVAPVLSAEARSGLDPNDDPKPIAREIRDWDGDAMIVGHLPFVAALVERLCGGAVAFTTASIVCLERIDDSQWIIAWVLRPDIVPPA